MVVVAVAAAAADEAVVTIVISTTPAMDLTTITQERRTPAGHNRPQQALTAKLTLTQPVSLPTYNLSSNLTTAHELTMAMTDGGYNNYLALWYQSIAAQQQAAATGGGQGDASKPPGTS